MRDDAYGPDAIARYDAEQDEREAAWLDQIDAEAQAAHARLATLPPALQAANAELRAIARAHLAHLAGARIVAHPAPDAGVVLAPHPMDVAPDPYTGQPEPLALARLFHHERMTVAVVVRQQQEQTARRADEALRGLTGRASRCSR